MKIEELKNKLETLRNDRDAKLMTICDIEDNMRDVMRDICNEYANEYKQYFGKKVRIEFYGHDYRFAKTVVGFIKSFKPERNFMALGSDVIPVVSKVKKNGTPSANVYADWDVMPVKYIHSITVIED